MKADRCLQSLDFDGLRQLAQACLPPGTLLALYDCRGDAVWRSLEADGMAELDALAPTCWLAVTGAETNSGGIALGGDPIQAGCLRWHDDEPAGLLLVRTPPNADPSERIAESVEAIVAGLTRELRMLMELEDMIDDLSDRYEELNLVFALDSDLSDASQAHQALHQLLRNCVEYRRAEFAILLHEEIDLCLHEGELPLSAPSLTALVADCRIHLLPQFRGGNHFWIDNHALTQLGAAHAMAYKILAAPIKAAQHGVVGIMAWLRDESSADFTNSGRNLLEAMAQRVELIVTSSFDPLTGLLNRSNFERSAEAYAQRGNVHREDLFLLHLDIDYLQILNDSVGTPAGDKLIRDGAHLIREVVADHGLTAHFGSGKFGVLLQQPSMDTADELAQSLCAQFSAIPCPGFAPTISLGLTPYRADSDYEEALAVAKAACLQAKKLGRNRVQISQRTEKDFVAYQHDLEWFNRIHHALSHNRLELFAQAIRPVTTPTEGQHYEVLLRMRGEQNEVIPPGVFLPTAERQNLMTLIDRYVVDKSFELLQRHRRSAPAAEVHLSVNLSAQSINDPAFQQFLLAKLEAHPQLTACFCFEVTETSALTDVHEGDDFLARLQAHGSTCSLDDFGTGLSSFSYLRHLRVDSVKIDGSFIKPLDSDPLCQAIVRSIKDIAVLKGISTVAEFVENDSILEQLSAIGIDYAQGYGVHKPEPLTAVLGRLAADDAATTGAPANSVSP